MSDDEVKAQADFVIDALKTGKAHLVHTPFYTSLEPGEKLYYRGAWYSPEEQARLDSASRIIVGGPDGGKILPPVKPKPSRQIYKVEGKVVPYIVNGHEWADIAVPDSPLYVNLSGVLLEDFKGKRVRITVEELPE
jgi:hypothetical protein